MKFKERFSLIPYTKYVGFYLKNMGNLNGPLTAWLRNGRQLFFPILIQQTTGNYEKTVLIHAILFILDFTHFTGNHNWIVCNQISCRYTLCHCSMPNGFNWYRWLHSWIQWQWILYKNFKEYRLISFSGGFRGGGQEALALAPCKIPPTQEPNSYDLLLD